MLAVDLYAGRELSRVDMPVDPESGYWEAIPVEGENFVLVCGFADCPETTQDAAGGWQVMLADGAQSDYVDLPYPHARPSLNPGSTQRRTAVPGWTTERFGEASVDFDRVWASAFDLGENRVMRLAEGPREIATVLTDSEGDYLTTLLKPGETVLPSFLVSPGALHLLAFDPRAEGTVGWIFAAGSGELVHTFDARGEVALQAAQWRTDGGGIDLLWRDGSDLLIDRFDLDHLAVGPSETDGQD